jgi:hypothetical protein
VSVRLEFDLGVRQLSMAEVVACVNARLREWFTDAPEITFEAGASAPDVTAWGEKAGEWRFRRGDEDVLSLSEVWVDALPDHDEEAGWWLILDAGHRTPGTYVLLCVVGGCVAAATGLLASDPGQLMLADTYVDAAVLHALAARLGGRTFDDAAREFARLRGSMTA